MPILENLKECAERPIGLGRPGKRNAAGFARLRKPNAIRFKDDGLVPNHPRWPLIIYRGAVAPVVVDRGMAFDSNLAEIKARKLHYIVAGRQPERDRWLAESRTPTASRRCCASARPLTQRRRRPRSRSRLR